MEKDIIKSLKIFENNKHSYNLEIANKSTADGDVITCFSLYYSNDSEWTNPGTLCCEARDDGNGLHLVMSNATKKKDIISMDYSHMHYLRILLNVINEEEPIKFVVKITKEEEYLIM